MNQMAHALLLGITFQPMSFLKFFALMTACFNEAAKQQGAADAALIKLIKSLSRQTHGSSV